MKKKQFRNSGTPRSVLGPCSSNKNISRQVPRVFLRSNSNLPDCNWDAATPYLMPSCKGISIEMQNKTGCRNLAFWQGWWYKASAYSVRFSRHTRQEAKVHLIVGYLTLWSLFSHTLIATPASESQCLPIPDCWLTVKTTMSLLNVPVCRSAQKGFSNKQSLSFKLNLKLQCYYYCILYLKYIVIISFDLRSLSGEKGFVKKRCCLFFLSF